MAPSTAIVLSAILAIGASPLCAYAQGERTSTEWQVYGFARNCDADDSTCNYGYAVDQPGEFGSCSGSSHSSRSNGTVFSPGNAYWCSFETHTQGGAVGQNASAEDFAQLKCNESEAGHLRTSGGYTESGAIVLTVVDLDRREWAWFGFEAYEIDGSATKSGNVYVDSGVKC